MIGKTYELYDDVILKDGRVGCIVDIHLLRRQHQYHEGRREEADPEEVL